MILKCESYYHIAGKMGVSTKMSVEAKTIEAVKEALQTHAVIDEFVFYNKIKKICG
ncbi:hypothetical protein [Lysinibacillus xylanilyticus]|uniref:Uncharacterized protein n=1 Tax=Lysinibacillus xylanilyticus TaxID=582475 RepID=A0ABT4ET45_9BACI|nr:hypothetical protein [Lysinibacillus xylanilyticus]MCY9548830.1 hypothetical protein [Lysinibacillus xylanilyticus]